MACKIDEIRKIKHTYIHIVILQWAYNMSYELMTAHTEITSHHRFHHAFTRVDPEHLAGSGTMFSAITAGEVTPEATGPTDWNPQQYKTKEDTSRERNPWDTLHMQPYYKHLLSMYRQNSNSIKIKKIKHTYIHLYIHHCDNPKYR